MHLVQVIALAALTSACQVHLHVHAAQEPGPADGPARPALRPLQTGPIAGSHDLAGRVLDGAGRPVKAHVSCVASSGSVSMRTDEAGAFRFDDLWEPEVVVTATTQGGAISITPAIPRGSEDLQLGPPEPGATLVVRMTGRPTARLALFDGDVRFEDFTVREGGTSTTIVPARPVRALLYGDDLEQEVALELTVGKRREIRFDT